MRVFISWSGELSRQLAEAIHNWLPVALQFVEPYFTPSDIDKGARWADEIAEELKASTVCIIVLTRENLNSQWIMFEAGAISATIERARICPIVFDIHKTDIQGPLAQFQATAFGEKDFRQLVLTINKAAGEKALLESRADASFKKWWPDLEEEVNKILERTVSGEPEVIRSERDLMEETLLLVRNFDERLSKIENLATDQVTRRATPIYGIPPPTPLQEEALRQIKASALAKELAAKSEEKRPSPDNSGSAPPGAPPKGAP